MAAGHSENDEGTVGPHDANLLYGARAQMVFSAREASALADAGVEAWADENKPLWSWLAECTSRFGPWLAYTSISGPDRRRVGALRILAALGGTVVYDQAHDATNLPRAWFADNSSADVRNAALDYLAERGGPDAIGLAKREFARNDFSTRKSALDAVILTKARESSREAALFASTASFDGIDGGAAAVVLRGMAELEDAQLIAALENRAGSLRARALTLLAERGKADEALLNRFFGDPAVEVRFAAVTAFEKFIRPLSRSEAESGLIRKQEKSALGLLASGYDSGGSAAFADWRRRNLASAPLSELREDGAYALASEDRVAARAIGHLDAVQDELRADLDDRYCAFWQRYLDVVRTQAGSGSRVDEFVRIFGTHEEFSRENLTRIALDGIERLRDAKDLPRVRKAIDEEACDRRGSDIDYLAEFGGWEDITRIGRMADSIRNTSIITLLTPPERSDRAVRAILKLAGERIAEVPALGLPDHVLAGVLATVPNTKFRRLSSETLDALIAHTDARVRKASALKILLALNVTTVRAQLARHLASTGTRYYNVTFWLDLCRSYNREDCRRIADRELKRLRG